MSYRQTLFLLMLSLLAFSCRSVRPDRLNFQPIIVEGDLELEKLNDEELKAKGEAAFAAKEFKQAARYFMRLADFHPQSRHRQSALYNAGLALQRLEQWEDAALRFSDLIRPVSDAPEAMDASFRLAECYYHLNRYDEAISLLVAISSIKDVDINKKMEAMVYQGICELEAGRSQMAESTLRKALGAYYKSPDKELIDEYFPSQAQFFLGEIYRIYFESVELEPDRGAEQLSKDLEYKSELLLSAQGNYLRAIRMGHGYWATAAGAQIGSLYEIFYQHMVNAPVPQELDAEQSEIYRIEVRKKIRVLLSKAITIYERTLEAAERIGVENAFVLRSKESLKKMKEQLVADSALDEESATETTTPSGS